VHLIGCATCARECGDRGSS